MLNVRSRFDRYPGMVHRNRLYGSDREPVLLFFVFVSESSFFGYVSDMIQGPLLSPNLDLKGDKHNSTQVIWGEDQGARCAEL